MKFLMLVCSVPSTLGRAPQGARGLKFISITLIILICIRSRPARGAWVEIGLADRFRTDWRRSRPARGAWVEILMVFGAVVLRMVAPRKGRVG